MTDVERVIGLIVQTELSAAGIGSSQPQGPVSVLESPAAPTLEALLALGASRVTDGGPLPVQTSLGLPA